MGNSVYMCSLLINIKKEQTQRQPHREKQRSLEDGEVKFLDAKLRTEITKNSMSSTL